MNGDGEVQLKNRIHVGRKHRKHPLVLAAGPELLAGRPVQRAQTLAADTELSNVMANAQATLSKGLASIANQAALDSDQQRDFGHRSTGFAIRLRQLHVVDRDRVPRLPAPRLRARPTLVLKFIKRGAPARDPHRHHAHLHANTSLSSLGILPGGTLTFSASTNATTYTSTGTDTVGDLINAINIDLPTNAHVTASINADGQLVITSMNNKDSIAVVGSGTDAAAIGFGAKNSSAQPTNAQLRQLRLGVVDGLFIDRDRQFDRIVCKRR